jgi:uncharacterized protein (DUF1015 family)
MATLHPFRALCPDPAHVAEVACVPYDVVSTDEARGLADGHPRSFLHVVRPEIDLPAGTDEHEAAVYETGAANLRRFAADGTLVQESAPTLYVYRLEMNGHAQTGVFGAVAVAEYDDGTIVRHERTRPDKEDDRTRHLLTQRAHAEPVMLAFRDDARVQALVDAATARPPLYAFTASDGVRHTLWRAPDADALAGAFEAVPRIYIADGHHRCAAAARAYHALADQGEAGPEDEAAFFPAVLFPIGEMRILPYHRVVNRLPGGPAAFEAALRERFAVRDGVDPDALVPGEAAFYLGRDWLGVTLPETRRPAVADRLTVARLGEHVLAPLLGIEDVRTHPDVGFVGGIRGTGHLRALVDEGRVALAVALPGTTMEELLAVSDAGELMPPKSTWFEPKLRSGLVVHPF